jgi:hypothetical protein
VRNRSSGGALGELRQRGADGRWDHPQRRHLGSERAPLGERRQPALEHEEPHVLERPALGELDRVVLAVVVEALEPADVADGGLGDHDPFEAPGDLVGEVVGRLDLCHPHDVAHRDDANEAVAVDDGNVAVAVLGEAGEGGRRVDVGCDAVGVGGHPFADGVGGRSRAGGDPANEVAFGEDPDRTFAVDDDDGTNSLLTHASGDGGDGLRGTGGDHRGAHDLGNEHGPLFCFSSAVP